ncbi:MAG: twitching motility two-component system response regulator PilH [Cellvibrionaceae bacterium]|jgi:twitching motility two-component system response regulator PilH
MQMKKILIVDDSHTHLVALQEVLDSINVEIITANSGPEAIKLSCSQMPNLIFMDIVMEEMSGFEACRTIKGDKETASIPIIFVSSKNSDADKIWAEKQGGAGLIGKPYEGEEILQQVRRFVNI